MASKIEVDEIFNAGGDNDSGIDLATNDAVKIKIANAVKAEVDSSGHVKLDTVKGYTSAASISVVGEGGSTTTNLQQGLAKMWIQFNGTGTISTQDSFNRGGLTDNGTGDYTVTYTNNMANDDYAVANGFNGVGALVQAVTTSTVQVQPTNSGGSAVDVSIVTITVFGDLA
jgi:hypothetical protein